MEEDRHGIPRLGTIRPGGFGRRPGLQQLRRHDHKSLDLDGARKVVHAALDAGITLFDTADSYGTDAGSETTLREILGDRRKDIALATKFASLLNREKSSRFNASRSYIMWAVEDIPRRLRTDYIDLSSIISPTR